MREEYSRPQIEKNEPKCFKRKYKIIKSFEIWSWKKFLIYDSLGFNLFLICYQILNIVDEFCKDERREGRRGSGSSGCVHVNQQRCVKKVSSVENSWLSQWVTLTIFEQSRFFVKQLNIEGSYFEVNYTWDESVCAVL